MSVVISAPDSAKEGDQVSVSVTVGNELGYNGQFNTELFVESTLIFSEFEVILNGESKTYTASFIMPASDVTVMAWVERYSYPDLIFYGADSKSIALEVLFTLGVSVSPPTAGYVIWVPVSVDLKYIEGTEVSLSAVAYTGYQFKQWSGDASGTSPQISIIMNSDKNIVASFESIPESEFQGFNIQEYNKM